MAALGLWLVLVPQASAAIDFEREVRPILAEHCWECHAGEENNGGLKLDERSALASQTDSGKSAIVAGQPQASELLRRVMSTHDEERMPPEGPPLNAAQIATLRDWISQGAVWPEAHGATASKMLVPSAAASQHSADSRYSVDKTTQHWAFQPLTSRRELQQLLVGSAQSAEATWAWNPIDHFILRARSQQQLQVAPDARAESLARRVAYGLTGLPPTLQQTAKFVQLTAAQGDSRQAQQELVEELLSSPAYGQRWGRHWMDWVRYADTAGDNSDYPIPQAYLYRNYVIDALNADLPYDRFLTEQLAGDLLPADSQQERNRQNIATGYLAMARRFGSLVERYPWHLTIEDTIDNVGRTMLGLTLSCARCHDHKFDPISTRDYYGLYGIFASTRYPMPGLELFKAQQYFTPLVDVDAAASWLAPKQAEIDRLTRELEEHLFKCDQRARENAARFSECTVEEQRRMNDELDAMLLKARRAGENLAKVLKELPEIPTAYAVQDASPHNARVQLKGEPTRPGAEVPRKFIDILGGQPLDPQVAAEQSGRLQLAEWITSAQNPLTARVIVNRLWQRHFGTGLVSSTSDFGLRGSPPTHPELLDWLAHELIDHAWSLKHVQRLILNSHTYQLSSTDIAENVARDPANQWYWKANRQRLDAESIRDTLLWLGDALDTVPQTEPHPFPPIKEWGYTQHHPFKDDYPSSKRSVYLMTKRLTTQSYFQTFDGPDPNVCTSDRDQSVTALQALYFVNDQFVHEQAQRLADKLLRSGSSEKDRLTEAFRLILGRAPTTEEHALVSDYLGQIKQRLPADEPTPVWASLVRSLLRLNEFMYLD